MIRLIKPIDLPENKDNNFIPRLIKAVEDSDFYMLDILATELESISDQDRENALWEITLSKILKENDRKKINIILNDYLITYPKGFHREEAKNELSWNKLILQYNNMDEKNEWSEWENIRFSLSLNNLYSLSNEIKNGKKRIKNISLIMDEKICTIEDKAWKKAVKLNNEKGYETYLSYNFYSKNNTSFIKHKSFSEDKLKEIQQEINQLKLYKRIGVITILICIVIASIYKYGFIFENGFLVFYCAIIYGLICGE